MSMPYIQHAVYSFMHKFKVENKLKKKRNAFLLSIKLILMCGFESKLKIEIKYLITYL